LDRDGVQTQLSVEFCRRPPALVGSRRKTLSPTGKNVNLVFDRYVGGRKAIDGDHNLLEAQVLVLIFFEPTPAESRLSSASARRPI